MAIVEPPDIEHFDDRYEKLIRHNKAVRENFEAIGGIKKAIAEEDWDQLAVYLANIPESVQEDIWRSPSSGGIFQTKEIAAMRSNELFAARNRYYTESKLALDQIEGEEK